MKVTATHWVNHNGVWHRPGETYDDGVTEKVEAPVEEAPEEETEQTVKRSRKRTKDE